MSKFSSSLSLISDDNSNLALKLLSIFDYITYEVAGGEEPEIFIRINDPSKVQSIVMGNTIYTNKYVTKAKQKHERDVAILLKFFNGLHDDAARWDFIEDYFLGYDVLESEDMQKQKPVKMSRSIDREHSYPTNVFKKWDDIKTFFDDGDYRILQRLSETGIRIPEYLETTIKHSEEGRCIIMSWPSKNVLICQQDTSDSTLAYFARKGWKAYRFYAIDYVEIKDALS